MSKKENALFLPLGFEQIWFEGTLTFLPLGREYFEKDIDELVMKVTKDEDVEKAGSRMSIAGLSCYHCHQLAISSTTGWYD